MKAREKAKVNDFPVNNVGAPSSSCSDADYGSFGLPRGELEVRAGEAGEVGRVYGRLNASRFYNSPHKTQQRQRMMG